MVEIEGIHHGFAATQIDDALRQNALTIDGDVVLRVPLLGPRLQEEEFMTQIAAALHSRRTRAA